LGDFLHEAVAGDFGYYRGGGDCGTFAVASDDWSLVVAGIGDCETV
jgi:hypothetical protein